VSALPTPADELELRLRRKTTMKRMKRLRMKTRVTCVLTIFAMLALETTALWPVPVEAAIVLDPTNPANFSSEGLQTITPGAVLTFTDQSIGDFALLFGNDADAVPGVENVSVGTGPLFLKIRSAS
jgi:hypothetical protein